MATHDSMPGGDGGGRVDRFDVGVKALRATRYWVVAVVIKHESNVVVKALCETTMVVGSRAIEVLVLGGCATDGGGHMGDGGSQQWVVMGHDG